MSKLTLAYSATELGRAVGLEVGRDLVQSQVLHNGDGREVHFRYQQKHNDIPVWGAEILENIAADGERFVTNHLVPSISIETKPLTDPDYSNAQAALTANCDCEPTSNPTYEHFIFRDQDGIDHDTLKVSFLGKRNGGGVTSPVAFFDVRSRTILHQYEGMQTLTGTGTATYAGNVSFETSQQSGRFFLEERVRHVGTVDLKDQPDPEVYDRVSDNDNVWNDNTRTKDAVEVHYNLGKTYDYFKAVHVRAGMDGAEGPITRGDLLLAGVHWSEVNAAWMPNLRMLVFGNGGPTNLGYISSYVSLDVVGHEFTHGVTQYSVGAGQGLLYYGESGALNESMSDVFGALVKRSVRGENADTWKVAPEIASGTIDRAIRYMDDPHRVAQRGFTTDDDPDHISEMYRGQFDNGGVHINSGIANKAFYLLAKGGTHHLSDETMTGIGADKAGKIWYTALTRFLSPMSGFTDARNATADAARLLYGSQSPEGSAVAQAWRMVGVDCGNANLALVSSANLKADTAPGSLMTIWGSNLSTATQVATTLPLPSNIAGTTVDFEDPNTGATQRAQLFFVSPTQINLVVPAEMATGRVIVKVRSSFVRCQVPDTNVSLSQVAPALFTAGKDYALGELLRIKFDGRRVYEPLGTVDRTTGAWIPTPIDLRADPNDDKIFLVLYGTGFRNTSMVTAQFGTATPRPIQTASHSNLVGVDQANILLTSDLNGRGEQSITLSALNKRSNTIKVVIK